MRAKIYVSIVIGLPLAGLVLHTALTVPKELLGFIRDCSPAGYSSDHYLAYCDSEHYGDFEHGAFYFEQEDAAVAALRRAEVVVIGNSMTQFAFSTDVVARELSRVPYYLLGFGYGEPWRFPVALFDKFELEPKVVIVGVDPYFLRDVMSAAAREVIERPDEALRRNRRKRIKQYLHAVLCRSPLFECGRDNVYFRSRSTGAWDTRFYKPSYDTPVTPRSDEDPLAVRQYAPRAKQLVQALRARTRCVVFVSVPSKHAWSAKTTRAIADAAGARFVDIGEVRSRWITTDGTHLARQDAEAWSAEAMRQLRASLQSCGVRL